MTTPRESAEGWEPGTPTSVAMEGITEASPGLGKRPKPDSFVDIDDDDDPTLLEVKAANPSQQTQQQAPPPQTTGSKGRDDKGICESKYYNEYHAKGDRRGTKGNLRSQDSGSEGGCVGERHQGVDDDLGTADCGIRVWRPAFGLRLFFFGGGGTPSYHKGESRKDFDLLGGEEGDTLVIGGFRNWADKTEREAEWELLKPRLPEELRDSISETIIPNSQCQIIILKIQRNPKRPLGHEEPSV